MSYITVFRYFPVFPRKYQYFSVFLTVPRNTLISRLFENPVIKTSIVFYTSIHRMAFNV